jgi:transcriptional regulator with XRE-family HTH domain
MTRTERLRAARAWTQPQMAAYLGVGQATVSRLESGQAESGPVKRLLDLLEHDIPPSVPRPEPALAEASA